MESFHFPLQEFVFQELETEQHTGIQACAFGCVLIAKASSILLQMS